MRFEKILDNIGYKLINGNLTTEIKDVVYDSRKANKDTVFVALIGVNADGHNFIKSAYEQGCRNIIVCKKIEVLEDMNIVEVMNTRQALGFIAANFFEHPEEKLFKIGLTGTKGKTTSSYMIKSVFEKAGYKIGVIGTMGVVFADKYYETKNTTPESYDVYKYFREMVDEGCTHVVMEVSSLALKHGRVNGIVFDYAIFTNLTPDHIGEQEHKDFNEYKYCKSLLFEQCKKAIINADDEHYSNMVANKKHTIFVGMNDIAQIKLENITYINRKGQVGTSFIINDYKKGNKFEVFLDMPGKFNVYNALNVIALALEEKIDNAKIIETFKEFKVLGRLEPVNVSNDFSVLIDYAHNGISMQSIIETMKSYPHKRIISLFGCGGERSKTRRVEMGEISGNLADFSIITEDNSRSEPFDNIVKDILEGTSKTNGKYVIIEDRAKAINYCLDNAKKGDIILLLGKGHETYMEKNGERFHFDE